VSILVLGGHGIGAAVDGELSPIGIVSGVPGGIAHNTDGRKGIVTILDHVHRYTAASLTLKGKTGILAQAEQ